MCWNSNTKNGFLVLSIIANYDFFIDWFVHYSILTKTNLRYNLQISTTTNNLEHTPISFAISLWGIPLEQREFLLKEIHPKFREKILNVMDILYQPQITMSWKYTTVENMRAEVFPDQIFTMMSWSDFHKISQAYKKSRILPSYKVWKAWYSRIWTERMLEYRRDICEDRYRIFSNEKEFNQELRRVDKQISSTDYGKQKLREMILRDVNTFLYRMTCIKNIKENWAALKIQKAYRRQECIHCGLLFHTGIGPFCSIRCIRSEFN